MTWEPDLASEEMERSMEEKDIPETDRDEIRRFAELLKRKADRKALDRVGGGPLRPMPDGMREWILGEE